MRLIMFQTIALLLTLTAWGSDVLHIMHMGAEESLAQHGATTGNEEPDGPRNDGIGDEPAITTDAIAVDALPSKGSIPLDYRVRCDGDDHSRALMRPPRAVFAA